MTRTAHRLAAAVGGAALVLVALTGTAAAHTEAEADAADAGRTQITFTVEAECGDGALPTSGLRIQVPEGATDVEPSDAGGWTTAATATEVSWSSADPAPGDATFVVEMVLAQPEGTMVYLPAIQQCPDGAEIAWIEIPQQPGEELSNPAPSIVVPANATTPTTEAAAPVTTAEGPTTTATMALEDTPITIEGSDTNTGGLVVLIVVAVVIIGGAVLLFLRYRTKGNNHPGNRGPGTPDELTDTPSTD